MRFKFLEIVKGGGRGTRPRFDFRGSGLPGWEAMLQDYPPGVILTRKSDRTHVVLERDGRWAKIYEDLTAMIFVPRSDLPGPALKKFHDRELVDPPGPPGFYFP